VLVVLAAAGTARAADPAAAPAPAAPAAPAPHSDEPGAAAPATPQETEMQMHRALGHRLYRLGRYEEAVAAFRRAYEVKADARLLFDIAECYRELGAVDQALFYYDRYLAAWPDAFDHAEVDEKVAALENMRGSGARTAPRAARRRPQLTITEPPPSKPRPTTHAWQRWWFWTAIGVGVLAGLGAAALSSSGGGPSVPMTELGDKRFF
jgi:tetratricopeptide (TPR) repeat protein